MLGFNGNKSGRGVPSRVDVILKELAKKQTQNSNAELKAQSDAQNPKWSAEDQALIDWFKSNHQERKAQNRPVSGYDFMEKIILKGPNSPEASCGFLQEQLRKLKEEIYKSPFK